MRTSKIIITDDPGVGIKIWIDHDVLPTGPKCEWSNSALVADRMVGLFLKNAEEFGIKPSIEATRSATTGEIDIVTRKNE